MIDAFVAEAPPHRVRFGVGSLGHVAEEVGALGVRRTLLIASSSGAPTARQVARMLGERHVGTFAEVRQHVPDELARAAAAAAEEVAADGLVTIGGGSATGLGKAVARSLGLPIVAVPTTYSGSELTDVYGITGERKVTGRDPSVRPRSVVYDPALTVGLPARVTATSGFNALAHAVEACYAPGANPVASLLAEEAVRVLGRALPAALDDLSDLDARAEALYGAHLAGLALAQAGIALHHRLCHVLGGTYGLGHGDVSAVVLPHAAAYNQPAVPTALARVATALDADDVGGALHALARRLGAPTSLGELGLSESELDAVAARAVTAVGDTNPRPVDEASLRTLLADAHAGGHPRDWKGAA